MSVTPGTLAVNLRAVQGVSWQASVEDNTGDARCRRGALVWGSRGSSMRGVPSSQILPRGAGSNRACDEYPTRLVRAVPTQPSARSAYSDGAAQLPVLPVHAASLPVLVLGPPLLPSCPHSLPPLGPLPPARASWRHHCREDSQSCRAPARQGSEGRRVPMAMPRQRSV